MASLTRWTWVWVNSGSWWWTGRPGVLNSWGCKESDMTERLNWNELNWTEPVRVESTQTKVFLHSVSKTFKSDRPPPSDVRIFIYGTPGRLTTVEIESHFLFPEADLKDRVHSLTKVTVRDKRVSLLKVRELGFPGSQREHCEPGLKTKDHSLNKQTNDRLTLGHSHEYMNSYSCHWDKTFFVQDSATC